MSGAPSRSSPTVPNSVATAGAALCVFSASASAHCSTNTKVPSASCSEYRSQPGSECTASMACLHASRTASTDSGLAFIVATTVTGMGDGLLAEYVLDGCLAYVGGFRVAQPVSTQIVMP